MIAAVFLSLVALAVIFAPLISPQPGRRRQSARWRHRDPRYILGTDQQGRDMLARLLYGDALAAGRHGANADRRRHRPRPRPSGGFLRGVIDQVITLPRRGLRLSMVLLAS
jgi:hypothetical protein